MGIELDLMPDAVVILILIVGMTIVIISWIGLMILLGNEYLKSRKRASNGTGRAQDGSVVCGCGSNRPTGPVLVHSRHEPVIKKKPAV